MGSDFYIEDNIFDGKALNFDGTPNSYFIPLFGASMKFMTSLVGVYDDNSWKTLRTFTWESDSSEVDLTGLGLSTVRNRLSENDRQFLINEGLYCDAIFNINVIDPNCLPLDIIALMNANGWKGQHEDVSTLLSLPTNNISPNPPRSRYSALS
ncbi:hypothetical protein [Nitrosomonas mobilis]|uniref:Uncharacterized protein n=1 Tax=Nitrosomonas mobilis TaxID=51642 RepID=A0A1G5SG06_9PROT|nr:hypothetical protein [Nitrosomonas mobilis]SCZ86124.1 hypothetical protein NSMM_490013 [Nitrosomonas mobilis]